MTTTVTVRNFTGKTIFLEVNPATKVSGLKDTIARTTLCKWAKPVLTWKGHELRDHQSLSHYNVADRDALWICECRFFGLNSRMALTWVNDQYRHRRYRRYFYSSKSQMVATLLSK